MVKRQEYQPSSCDGCGHIFDYSGDTIFILKLSIGLYRGDYCKTCKDKIITFLNKLSIPIEEEEVPLNEVTNHQPNHETETHTQ